jgi:hypothetical protein
MVSPRRLYRRFDEWSRNLSRISYAVLVGVVSGLSFLGVSAVFGNTMVAGAVAFGATMVLFHYVFKSNQTALLKTSLTTKF